jgi:hypothetical protein
MTDTSDAHVGWPSAELDAIARLRVIEAANPFVAAAEGVVDAPWISDLERSVPEFDGSVSRIRINRRDGADLAISAWSGKVPVPLPLRARLEEGFCLMQGRGRIYLVGMAAVAEGDRTRVRHVEGVPLPGIGRLARAAVQREVRHDLKGMIRHFARG